MRNHRLLVLLAGVLLLAATAFAQVGTIEGSVLLPMQGGPAVGALVMLHGSNHDTVITHSDSLGQFHFAAVPVGEWVLHAYLAPYRPANGFVRILSGQTVHPVLVLQTEPTGYGQLEGRVLLPFEGGPAAGARVVLFRAAGDSLVTLTNAMGEFAFDSARTGHHDIHATLDGYRIVYGDVFIPEGGTGHITLVLRSLLTGFGRLDGVVLLPMNGGPAAGATVSVCGLSDTLVMVTDAQGHFAFDTVSTGQYNLYARLAGYEQAWLHVFVPDGGVAHVTLVLHGNVLPGSGRVEGSVLLADGTPAARALVRLDGAGPHRHFQTETDLQGLFGFPHIPAGDYGITAMLPMHGFANARITVADSELTAVTLVLNDCAHGGGHHGDSLTIVELAGTAIVITEASDSLNRPPRVFYLLDVDGDGAGDFRLAFGPPWYHPQGSDAHRPAHGDSITIRGGLLTYAQPPVVVVYAINGHFWREPFHGHGGHGGGDHGQGLCRPDSLTRVELTGIARVNATGGYHGEHTAYALMGADSTVLAFLDFGRPDYVPESGAVRPLNGDAIAIVGGEIYCPDARTPLVIVYEINGLFWREPGDTLGLGAATPMAVDEPVAIGAPTTYLTARNYPNPFNPTTTIQYTVPAAGPVTLRVFDVAGREVAVLVNQTQSAGSYAIAWDGQGSASGIYFYRLTAGSQSLTQRMTLIK